MKFEGSAEIGRCLDAATVASYIDHRLSLSERNRVEAHLARCPACVAVVAGTVRTIDQIVGALIEKLEER